MTPRVMAGACLVLCISAANAQQVQPQYPDIVGAMQRGYEQGQAQRMREIQIQQAQQELEQQRQYEAQQAQAVADQEQLRHLSSELMAATNDKDRWDILTKIAAIDPSLAASYASALKMDRQQ